MHLSTARAEQVSQKNKENRLFVIVNLVVTQFKNISMQIIV